MAPMLDQMVALPVALAAAALAVVGMRHERIRGAIVVAGLAAGGASLLSYGAAAFVGIAGLAAGAAGLARHVPLRTLALRFAAAALLAAAVFLSPAFAGHHPLASARLALAIHREYFTGPREYGAWLVFNLVDAAIFLGPAVALAFGAQVLAARRGTPTDGLRTPVTAYAIGAAAGLALLLVSGVTRGEVGRLWIPLMPVALVPALLEAGAPDAPTPRSAALLAVLLTAVDLALRTAWRVPS
jgi:hypothetical protein